MKTKTVAKMLTDPSAPMKTRVEILRQVCSADEEIAELMLIELLEAAGKGSADQQAVAKAEELAQMVQQLQEGPMRSATFDCLIDSELLGRRAQVILQDGTEAFCALPDATLADALRRGDTVWLDGQARALLFHQPEPVTRGEEGRLERCLPGGDVEVSISEMSRLVCRTSARLSEQIERGEACPGSSLVVCPRRMIAFYALPPPDGLSHMRFLSREPVPDVNVERDVGAPPPFIDELASHVERELTKPDVGRRYGLRRARTHLLTGVPGSGKTLSIQALWRRIYEITADFAGVAIEDLPQRVLQLRSSDVLSKWVGESDQNIARFFDEVEQIAGETFETADGRAVELPVLVICEEIDALARQRGSDAIHDRIQATLLTSLDPARGLFRDRLVVVVGTTNAAGLVDPAFWRRIGGTVSHFGGLNRSSFRAVLHKHLNGRPFRGQNGASGDASRRRAVADLTAWLFAPNGNDAGQVEITFMNQPNPVRKHRRDFLTGGLVDRAVQEATRAACDDEWRGVEDPGLSTERLMCALDAQVRNIVDQLTPGNCEQYLTLPDATRVGTVRRIPQAPVLPIELERPH
jgi:ATP-dependent 26S proteasome regulatory subunit